MRDAATAGKTTAPESSRRAAAERPTAPPSKEAKASEAAAASTRFEMAPGGSTSSYPGTRSPGTSPCEPRRRGSREDAEVALARLKVADRERRLPTGGTSARSVRAAWSSISRRRVRTH